MGVMIEGMKMPKGCQGYRSDTDEMTDCPLFNVCKRRETIMVNYRPCYCPLKEINPLTDTEQRIFLSAITREEAVCKSVDSEKVDDGQAVMLVPVVESIERKVKAALWQ